MQFNGKHFLSNCLESEGKVEATVIQTSMIKDSKIKLQVGIILIYVSKNYKLESY
jgi:hypothetical protein